MIATGSATGHSNKDRDSGEMLNDKELMRESLIHQLETLPDEQLPAVVDFLEHLGKRQEQAQGQNSVMAFAGAWADMDDQELDAFLAETRQRRHQAFSHRSER